MDIEENFSEVSLELLEYLKSKFTELDINILGKYKGKLFRLMYEGKLEGWCWQTTETAALFLEDSDYIERGFLYLNEKIPKYFHSWICFHYNNNEYIFDPCLCFICKKTDYFKLFKPDVKAVVFANAVKVEFIRQITSPETQKEKNEVLENILKASIGDAYDEIKSEVIVSGPENVNTPLYRNGAGYIAEIENNNVRKLKVHYYYTDI